MWQTPALLAQELSVLQRAAAELEYSTDRRPDLEVWDLAGIF